MKLKTSCLMLLMLVAGLASCTRSQKEIIPSAEYAPFVSAYTGGMVSQSSPIRIELAQEQPMVDLNNALEENPFSFSPSLEGKAYWVNNTTIEFVPQEGALKPGEMYEASFQLGRFVKVDDALEEFAFSFRVQERNFSLRIEPLDVAANNPAFASIKGELRFSDKTTREQVERMLSVGGNEQQAPIIDIEPTNDASLYNFTLSRIERAERDYSLEIKADGAAAEVNHKLSETVLIPAKGSFRFLSAKQIERPENGLQVVFSDPISELQDLKGLIEIQGLTSYIFQVMDNKVNIYFEPNQSAQLSLNIHQGVKNLEGVSLDSAHTLSFGELNLKPQVELLTEGAILPDSKNLVIPFRAVNLYAVDMKIIRIFESNVLMFMQTNSLATANELRRSGRMVHQKTLYLGNDPSKDMRKWEEYSIDLSGLIRQEPGAIYRIVLSFKQEYSAYPCGGESKQMQYTTTTGQLTKIASTERSEEEESVWDTPQSYYGGYEGMDWSNYKWEERNNPCHPSYYMLAERTASCNVLASNIGMIAKRNSLNKVWVAVSSILDTAPIKKAEITVYNFQLQPIGKETTDADGFATIECKGVPFIVVAQADKQKTYVRVADGEEQSVSRFDVGGKEIRKGLKGFIYGERGVWRPGDTLHLAFMLEDHEGRIPHHHPVALELYNPRGQFYTKLIRTNGVNGLYTFDLATRPDDPTGLWNVYVKVGGTAFHKSLRIETVKPNRLKINLEAPSLLRAELKQVELPLSAVWLTGATASGLKVKVEMTMLKTNTVFEGYKGYMFNNPATTFSAAKLDVYNGTLDAAGNATMLLRLPQTSNAPGMLRANITTRVYEPGGDASISTKSIPYSPFSSYVGIDLNQPEGRYMETDKNHTFDVVTVNANGKPVSRTGLEYKIYRIGWSWWWEHADESFATYINSSSYTPVATGKLNTTTNGKAQFSFRVDYPAWGRYLVYVKDPESGHATGGTIYVDWPEWRGRSNKTDPSGIKMLAFSLDKESYETGETATAIIPAAAKGRALVTLENGSTVMHREWIEVSDKEDTKFSFKVLPHMSPNVYLHISLLQPHAQTVNDLPIRMYGVMPVFVTNKQTILEPQIKMPDVLRPEQEFAVSVSEKNGKEMTYSLAIVDDGLLDLTNFKTPDPWNEFYAREALGIRTWDMYDNVLGAYTGSYSSMFSTGGDEALKPSEAKANRFKPVVKFLGPFVLPKGKSRTHRMTLPMYVGSVRTMVIAGQDGAYGNTEKTTPVRTPLMVLASLPRVLSTQEEILLPINVFAMENRVKNVAVSVETSGKARLAGGNRQSVAFTQPGDRLLFFKLRTGSNTGKETIRISATGNGQSTRETIEIEVRNPNPAVALRQSQWVEGGKSGELSFDRSSNAPGNSTRLEVARIPSVDFGRRFDFLYNYGHDCTEQLTSKALPLLFVSQFKATDAPESEKIKANVQEAIKKLYARQLPNGGFVYWPGNASADEWVSSYAGMFLWLAQERGYSVNANVLNKWKRFQRAAAQNWKAPSREEIDPYQQWDAQQAFRLYTLALANAPEQGAMNRMKEMQQQLSLQAKWRLAAAYALTGKMKAANELVYNAQTTIEPYSSASGRFVYGSNHRDESMILETLLLMKQERKALEQAKIVSRNLAQESWFDTQSTAFAMLAMGRLAEQLSGTLDFQWSVNGKQQPAVKSAKALYEASLSSSKRGTVMVKNNGKGALSMDVITRTQLVNDTLPAIANNLRLDVRYVGANGSPISIDQLKQGADFTAFATVANISGTTNYTNLALTQIIPSGWEIVNDRMSIDTEQATKNYTYQDIRDDRVLTYFHLDRGESKTFAVRLQATYAGVFILPAVQCEAMYDAGVQARTRAGKVTVER